MPLSSLMANNIPSTKKLKKSYKILLTLVNHWLVDKSVVKKNRKTLKKQVLTDVCWMSFLLWLLDSNHCLRRGQFLYLCLSARINWHIGLFIAGILFSTAFYVYRCHHLLLLKLNEENTILGIIRLKDSVQRYQEITGFLQILRNYVRRRSRK
jgi:hypothetical protein